MKCPWNDWKDCYEDECPYYVQRVKEIDRQQQGGYRVVTKPVCRRVNIEAMKKCEEALEGMWE